MRGLGVLVAALALAAPAQAADSELRPFGSCAELVDYARPFLPRPSPPVPAGATNVVSVPGQANQAPAAPARSSGRDFSTTNVQEAGVDEPDLVKTDGRRLYVTAQGKLNVVDGRSRAPRLLGSLKLDSAQSHRLFLYRNRAIVISEPLVGLRFYPQQTVVREVDVSDPEAMRIVRTVTLPGSYRAARLHNAILRLVVRSSLRTPFAGPALDAGALLPEADGRPLVQCHQIHRPPSFAGFSMTAVVTFDLDGGLDRVDSDAVLADGQTVYASARSLYVARPSWWAYPVVGPVPIPMPRPIVPALHRTALHRFETEGRATSLVATGEVPGTLLDEWSLSEHRGLLRVVTTRDDMGGRQSVLSVVAQREKKLEAIGGVGGLGRFEDLKAVRFMGDVAYAVTFRQKDPLYTIDLSRPSRPKIVGKLDVPGFSTYLHPVGKGLLLGVGRDGDWFGETGAMQLSIFDVSNPAKPRRVHKRSVKEARSEAEVDHHAFLYWGPKRLVVVPLGIPVRKGKPFVGVLGFRLSNRGINELGHVSHGNGSHLAWQLEPKPSMPIRRSVVVGEKLFTVSEAGVRANDLRTFRDRGGAVFWD